MSRKLLIDKLALVMLFCLMLTGILSVQGSIYQTSTTKLQASPETATLGVVIDHTYSGDLDVWVGAKGSGISPKEVQIVEHDVTRHKSGISQTWDLFSLGFTEDYFKPGVTWYLKIYDNYYWDHGHLVSFWIEYDGKKYSSPSHPDILDFQTVYAYLKIPGGPKLTLSTPEVRAGGVVFVDGSVSPYAPDLTVTRIIWDWGDGTTSESWFPATHTYTTPGTYTITIIAEQSDGLSTTMEVQVDVLMGTVNVLVKDEKGFIIKTVRIYVDGKEVCDTKEGRTTLKVLPGKHTIKAVRTPLIPAEMEFEISADEVIDIELVLQSTPKPSPSPTPSPTPSISPSPSPSPSPTPSLIQRLLQNKMILIGLAAALLVVIILIIVLMR